MKFAEYYTVARAGRYALWDGKSLTAVKTYLEDTGKSQAVANGHAKPIFDAAVMQDGTLIITKGTDVVGKIAKGLWFQVRYYYGTKWAVELHSDQKVTQLGLYSEDEIAPVLRGNPA